MIKYYFTIDKQQKQSIIRQKKDRFTPEQTEIIKQMSVILEKHLKRD